jgi:hypothetical protein
MGYLLDDAEISDDDINFWNVAPLYDSTFFQNLFKNDLGSNLFIQSRSSFILINAV